MKGVSALATQTGGLTHLGKAVVAGGGVVANAARNKIVGNPSGFRWANVAASAFTAYAGSRLELGNKPIVEGLDPSGIVNDTIGGIARAGISYSVTKGIFNEGSWNFVDVAVDAFGNAIGNSIVSAGRGGNAASGADSAKSTQAGQSAYQQAIANGQSAPQAQKAAVLAVVEASGSSAAVDLTGETASRLTAEQSFNPDNAFRLSNGTDSAIINYGDASNINSTLSAVAGFLSSAPAGDLAYRYASQNIIGKHNRDITFANAVAKGEASYNYHARDRLAGIANDARNNRISIASNRAIYERDKAFGTVGDLAYGTAEGFVDSIYQGVQFLGTSLAAISPVGQATSYLSGNGALNPFTTDYHSLLDEPTTFQQAAGRTHGEILSFAAGGEGLLLGAAKIGKGIVAGRASASSTPLSYDISRWAEYGLPSDGKFVRTLTPQQYLDFKAGRQFDFAGGKFPDEGFPDGMGFIGAAEEVRHIDTVSGYREALKLDYDPKIIMEFQLRNPAGLQNVLDAPFEEFIRGGKTGAGFSEWNYLGINSSNTVNPTIRVLR